jgi:hypothetical protein
MARRSVLITSILLAALLATCLSSNIACAHKQIPDEVTNTSLTSTLPSNFRQELDRFTFINTSTGETLKDFRILGGTSGTYEEGRVIFDTYTVSFEDRYAGKEADQDFLDVIVEMKQERDSGSMTVRVVQLGLDTIEVYLDGKLLDSIRPALEVQIECGGKA